MDDSDYGVKQGLLPTLSLFTSAGTLVCCALPALLVTLGAGAALAGIVETLLADCVVKIQNLDVWNLGAMVLVAGISLWRSRNASCPIDPAQAIACSRLRKTSVWIYWLSVFLWCTGFSSPS